MKNGRLLSAADFRAGCGRRYREIEIPGFGRTRLKDLSQLESSQVTQSKFDETGQYDPERAAYVHCHLIRHSVVDEAGEKIWNEDEISLIAEMPIAVTSMLINAIFEFNDVEMPEGEELKKSSEPSELTPTTLPTSSVTPMSM